MSNRKYHGARFGGSKSASFGIGRKTRILDIIRKLLPATPDKFSYICFGAIPVDEILLIARAVDDLLA